MFYTEMVQASFGCWRHTIAALSRRDTHEPTPYLPLVPQKRDLVLRRMLGWGVVPRVSSRCVLAPLCALGFEEL